ncbi:MAG: hypothetical protein HQL90_04670 [Magnetococcales bacterium]|nr:hypothetical protein [Magnetococcales bacterium]
MGTPFGLRLNAHLFILQRYWSVSAGVTLLLSMVPNGVTAVAAEPDPQEQQRFDAGVQQTQQKLLERIERLPSQATKTVIRANMPKKQTALTDLTVSVGAFRVDGISDLPVDALNQLLEPWKDRALNFTDFERVVHSVAEYLREHGYPEASVVVSRTQIRNGTVAMAIQGLKRQTTLLAMPQLPVAAQPRVMVEEIAVSGITMASAEEVQQAVSRWSNRELTVAEMEEAAAAVAALLREKGATLAQAYLPPQSLDKGVLEIAALEGLVDGESGHNGIVVSGAGERIRPEQVEAFLAPAVVPDKPVDVAKLESGLRLLKELPGVKDVHTDLAPGSRPGTSRVEAKVEEDALVTGAAWVDNFGSVYTGATRTNVQMNLNAPTGHGERLTITANHGSGMRSGKVAAQMPVGSAGAKVGISYAHMDLDIGQEVEYLNLDSSTNVVSLHGNYPLFRGQTHNADVSVNLDHKRLSNEMSDIPINQRDLDIATVGYSGNVLDPWDGTVNWGLNLTLGNLDLSGNKINQELDTATAKTAGTFSKAAWNLARQANILDSKAWSYRVAHSGQLAGGNLDSSEKFQLGGPTGVRAYPVGEGLGDDGWLTSVEVNRTLGTLGPGTVTAQTFADAGWVKQYKEPWDTALIDRPNSYHLKGFGAGANWENGNTSSIRASVARKIGDNPNKTRANTDSDGGDKDTRLWIIGTINF